MRYFGVIFGAIFGALFEGIFGVIFGATSGVPKMNSGLGTLTREQNPDLQAIGSWAYGKH